MTLAEYYGFPEGTNCVRKYYNVTDEGANYPLNGDLSYFFNEEEQRYALPDLKDCKPTKMNYFAAECKGVETLDSLQYIDTSNCDNFSYAFNYLSGITSTNGISNWDTSKATNMANMFNYCSGLLNADISNWDTSKVTNMSSMFAYCNKLTTLSTIDCTSVAQNQYPLQAYSNNTTLTTVGGFINMKSSWDNNYGLSKFTNLTYESCINILNGLYDFTGNNQTPTSTQGKLKVHANFLTTVGDEISIGTSRGWVITT